MNISLPKEFEDYVAAQVESGQYSSAADVVVDALRQHKLQELEKRFAAARKQVSDGAVTEATTEFFDAARDRIRRRVAR
jgi:putative addiction module CopG family antidote